MTFLVDGTNGGFFPSWTTATRPASPAVGQMGYNTTTGLFDQYIAAGWTPLGAAAGSVLQVVQNSYSTITLTTSTSFVTTGLNATITPKFSTSKILILVNGVIYTNTNGTFGYYTIFRGTVAGTNLATNAFNIMGASSSDLEAAAAMSYLDSPATTSATTYTVGLRAVSGTVYWAANSSTTTIQLLEIAA